MFTCPAADVVPLIEAAMEADQRQRYAEHLSAMQTLTTLPASYRDRAGRAILEAFLTGTRSQWRGPEASQIRTSLRASLRSGQAFCGLVTLLHFDPLVGHA